MRDVLLAASGLGCAPAYRPANLALVLAVDVSGSVDPQEYEIQMQGLGAALADGAVTEALVVAQAKVMLIQWTGTSRQKVSLPWTQVTDFRRPPTQVAARVTEGLKCESGAAFSTAIGEAVGVRVGAV